MIVWQDVEEEVGELYRGKGEFVRILRGEALSGGGAAERE